MTVQEAIQTRRSVRRFLPKEISKEIMEELLRNAGLYASGGNKQPVRLMAVTGKALRDKIFACTRWAAYLPGFQIAEDQRPNGYIFLLAENPSACGFDLGAAATTVMLNARALGLDTCCLGALDREGLAAQLPVPEGLQIADVIALGYGAQECRTVPMQDTVKYYEAEDGTFCVPKRSYEELVCFTVLD